MKKLLSIILLFLSSLSAQQFYYTFSELKGIEDSNSNTHLFPRLYSEWHSGQSYEYRNDIYHFDLQTNIDSLFLKDYSFYNTLYGGGIAITDYDFWNNDPSKYIFCYIGTEFDESPSAIIQRFDSKMPNHYWLTNPPSVGISKQDDSILFGTNSMIIGSIDGGWTWNEKNIFDYHFLNLSPYNDNVHFYIAGGGTLYKTTDGGNTFFQVDTNSSTSIYPYIGQEILFDNDSNYIYRKYRNYNKYYFSVSNNKGDPFSWVIKYSSDNKIFISIDYSQSGNIYLADGRYIYHSTDYGITFNEYKVLNRNIVGIYKKPSAIGGSDKLYAATKYDLYEITPDTIIVIKSLPIDPKEFEWFPLSITNKWIYDNRWYGDLGDSARWISKWEVINHRVIDNKVYAEILITDFENYSSVSPDADYKYFRVDSSEGLVYQAVIENDTVTYEELYMDLLADVGDTIQVGNGIYLDSEVPFTQFNLNSKKRTFLHVLTPAQQIELVKGFGLVYDFWWELIEFRKTLKGCIINGIVYGDTNTVLSVDDEFEDLPAEFSLSQNYPNPFNPRTKIKFTISDFGFVTLKVYDVLGREVATLVNEEKHPGVYEVEFNTSELSSGIYFYKLQAENYSSTKKMIYLK
jgi:hypothetical protein